MGYRSDVRIATTKECYEKFVARMDNNALFNPNPEIFEEKGNTIVFGWDWVKWYGYFDEVRQVETACEELSEEYPMEFVCIGEEAGDIEEWASDTSEDLEWHIEASTKINVWQ